MNMTRKDLTEMIRQEIRSLAFETLRNTTKEKSKVTKPKGLSEEELEFTLFYGGNKPEESDITKILPVTIKESYDNGIPKIQSSEIKLFEDSFEEMLGDVDGASVVFDKQSNGYSLKVWIGPEGIEAGASGIIEMGRKGKINWSFSLKNGLIVTTKDLGLDKGNKMVFDKLYNNYNAWQKEWREKLTIQPGQVDNSAEIPAAEPSAEIPPAPETP